jgi:hypothetical protein
MQSSSWKMILRPIALQTLIIPMKGRWLGWKARIGLREVARKEWTAPLICMHRTMVLRKMTGMSLSSQVLFRLKRTHTN